MFPERLKKLRKQRGMSQQTLAEKMNTTKATISNYENSYSSPSIDGLSLLADILNTTTDYLLGRTDKVDDGAIEKLHSPNELSKLFDHLIIPYKEGIEKLTEEDKTILQTDVEYTLRKAQRREK